MRKSQAVLLAYKAIIIDQNIGLLLRALQKSLSMTKLNWLVKGSQFMFRVGPFIVWRI